VNGVRVRLVGDWERARQILRSHRDGRALRCAFDRAVRAEAERYVRDVKQGVRRGAPGGQRLTPNRPLTVGRKRSNKPLIDHADLINSVRVRRVRSMEYFGGVSRGARRRGGRGGASIVSIAAVHERGKVIVIRVTPAMHRYFFSMLRSVTGSLSRRRSSGTKPVGGTKRSGGAIPLFRPGAVLVIRIRPRPFLEPVFDRRRRGAERRILRDVSIATGGAFGTAS